MRRELGLQGWKAGWRPLVDVLGHLFPVRLIQRCVQRWKAWRRRRLERRRRRIRQHVEVKARDAMWSLDATQVGRLEKKAILAEILRDVGSGKTLCAQVGPAATADEVEMLLRRTRDERGGLPLVLVTDNGSAYQSKALGKYLHRHHVIHLRSLPRTPQHNPWSEHGNSEIKNEAEVSSDQAIESLGSVTGKPVRAIRCVDDHRARPRAGRTNSARDRIMRRAYNAVDRDRYYATTRAAMQEAVGWHEGRRAQRRAEREAIYVSLESYGLVVRTRGDGGAMPVKGERIT